MKLQFKTKLSESVNFNGNVLPLLEGIEYSMECVKAEIEYTAEIDVREWGIYGITVNVDRIKINADINVSKEELDNDQVEKLKLFGFTNYQNELILFNWELTSFDEIITSDLFINNGQLLINQLDIYFSVGDAREIKATLI